MAGRIRGAEDEWMDDWKREGKIRNKRGAIAKKERKTRPPRYMARRKSAHGVQSHDRNNQLQDHPLRQYC
jgi:ribosomal protein S30